MCCQWPKSLMDPLHRQNQQNEPSQVVWDEMIITSQSFETNFPPRLAETIADDDYISEKKERREEKRKKEKKKHLTFSHDAATNTGIQMQRDRMTCTHTHTHTHTARR